MVLPPQAKEDCQFCQRLTASLICRLLDGLDDPCLCDCGLCFCEPNILTVLSFNRLVDLTFRGRQEIATSDIDFGALGFSGRSDYSARAQLPLAVSAALKEGRVSPGAVVFSGFVYSVMCFDH